MRQGSGYAKTAAAAIFLVFAPLLAGRPASAADTSALASRNGLVIRLYTPNDCMGMTSRNAEGRLVLTLADGTTYVLVESIDDPEIVNKGDGRFHPMKPAWVMDGLRKVNVGNADMNMIVDVYILPLPRSGLLASSCCGANLILSPGVYDIDRAHVEYTATHELGHAFQFRYAPANGDTAWSDYLSIRGLLDQATYSEWAARMYRPSEIFAEDFRALFGGADASAGGAVENVDIPLPKDVPGLREYFIALLTPATVAAAAPAGPPFSVSSFPNPFNPSTTVRVSWEGASAGREVDVAIYRVDGSLVKRLYRGSVPADGISMSWDGRDAAGRPAASGVYLCAARAGGRTVVDKMILVR